MTVSENVVRLTIASQLEFIDLVTNLTDCLTNMAGFDEEAVYWINMAVRESVANAVEHGNQYDPNKAVDVTFVLSSENLHVSVRDRGEGFDPANLPDPLDPLNLLNPAGRGILYMRTFMDQIDYQLHPEGGMVVTMIKTRQSKEDLLTQENGESGGPHPDTKDARDANDAIGN
jgi:serine/threonine-protein kinase RsbW